MKKRSIHIALFAVAVILFSSCLGDSHSTQESGNTLGYISTTPDNGLMKAALTPVFGFVTSTDITNSTSFVKGRFYEMSFKYDSRNGFTDGAYNVTNVNLVNTYGDPIPDPWMDKRESSFFRVSSMPANEKEVYPLQAELRFFSSYQEYLGDLYVFRYSCKLYKDEIREKEDYGGQVELIAYLDNSNQNQGTDPTIATDPLDDNKIRINLVLRRTSTSDSGLNTSLDEVTYTGWGVVDLSEVRQVLKSRGIVQQGSQGGVGYIQFQYSSYNSSDKNKPTVRTIGSFASGASDIVQMYIPD